MEFTNLSSGRLNEERRFLGSSKRWQLNALRTKSSLAYLPVYVSTSRLFAVWAAQKPATTSFTLLLLHISAGVSTSSVANFFATIRSRTCPIAQCYTLSYLTGSRYEH